MDPVANPLPGTLPVLVKQRFTSTHILRWLAAQQNWDKIHFDQQYCREVAQLDAPVINGALKQHLIVQFLAHGLPGSWPWRIDYQFNGPDFVGDKLRVQGKMTGGQDVDGHTFISVAVEIFNIDRNQVTTLGNAVVVQNKPGKPPLLDAIGLRGPEVFGLNQSVSAAESGVPDSIRAHLGKRIDTKQSAYPIDHSRLRLFAEAVMDMAPIHFDVQAGAQSPWGSVVAPALFPLHGMEPRPGTLPLSEDARALGREGVYEVGRNLAQVFGLDPAGGMNAGNQVEVHSLARVGETVQADSTLVGAKRRTGTRGGEMFFFETLNRYTVSTGRPLITERQTVVLRLVSGT